MNASASSARARKLRIGMLRLTDSAPLVIAYEFGFFADEGLDIEIAVEPSWANVADKLAFGFLEGAIVVPPLAFAIDLGLRGVAQPLIVASSISFGGNAITLARDAAEAIGASAQRDGVTIAQSLSRFVKRQPERLTLGVVHAFSTHNLLLRYWLAAAHVDPDEDVKIVVTPPSLAVEALRNRLISGFCAGAPWGEVARRAGVGAAIATSGDVWRCAPEKALAVRARWAEENPQSLTGLIRALLRAAQFCDLPENSAYVAAVLSRRKYVNVDSHAILASLSGGSAPTGERSIFFRSAAAFPWRSHAMWFLEQMARWGLCDPRCDFRAVSSRIYRPDLFRAAAASLGISAPAADAKREGVHAQPWTTEGSFSGIGMAADLFCDGAAFDPEAI